MVQDFDLLDSQGNSSLPNRGVRQLVPSNKSLETTRVNVAKIRTAFVQFSRGECSIGFTAHVSDQPFGCSSSSHEQIND